VTGKRSNKSGRRKTRVKGKAPKRRKSAVYWGAVVAVWGEILGFLTIGYYALTLPDVSNLGANRRNPTVTLAAYDGSILETRGDIYGQTLAFDDLPANLVNAVIATEDRRFYSHSGVDLVGLGRAMIANLKSGAIVQGGSTLTQQLAKNLFLTPKRTIGRKVREVMLAFWLEWKFTKHELLGLYLNRVYLGAGTYGADAAARRYFGVDARALTLPQAAMLAGLLKAPTRCAPTRDLERSRRRAAQVLDNMVVAGYLGFDAARQAKAAPATPRPAAATGELRYFTNWMLDRLLDYVGPTERNLLVTTTLDPWHQVLAEKTLKQTLKREGERLAAGQGAFLAMD